MHSVDSNVAYSTMSTYFNASKRRHFADKDLYDIESKLSSNAAATDGDDEIPTISPTGSSMNFGLLSIVV